MYVNSKDPVRNVSRRGAFRAARSALQRPTRSRFIHTFRAWVTKPSLLRTGNEGTHLLDNFVRLTDLAHLLGSTVRLKGITHIFHGAVRFRAGLSLLYIFSHA
ncbi:hypothetical protein GCM10008020_20010 [Massilia psychrophila]|jgi:hypothetical protein|nr:hypothetical protein GCM10008020_20010 [Massilia psychrophila]